MRIERLAKLDEQLGQLDAELAARRSELEVYRENWGEAVAAPGLPPDATAAEALEVLDDLSTLMGNVDSLEAMRGRIAGMERDAREFEKLDAELADLERQLIDHGGGADLAGLFELTEGVEDGPARGRVAEIHLDDERASAALSVLAELAQTTEALFLTHHHHLLELARAALPTDQLVEHRSMEARQQALAAPV